MFDVGQYRLVLDSNLEARRDLILNEYSIIVSDTAQDIEIKLKKLHCDVLKNKDVLYSLPQPYLLY